MSRVVVVMVLAGLLSSACAAVQGTSGDFVDIPGLGTTRIDVPRPTDTVGADCTLALAPGESVAERAAGLRRIGFFADLAALPDAALGAQVEAALVEVWGEPDPADPFLELLVAEQDASRVWWRDLEADVINGNDVYRTTLEEWAAISAGAFSPSAITETWASETGPVTVSFDMDGQRHVLEPAYLEDWIDPGITVAINDLIADSGRQFTMVQAFDQTAFVVALTDAERAALEARGWCFEA